MTRYHKIAKELAGITRPLRIHDLHHTFGSNIATQRVPIQITAQMMGHTTTRMTEKYARPDADVTGDVVAEAMKKLGERRDPEAPELLRELLGEKRKKTALAGSSAAPASPPSPRR